MRPPKGLTVKYDQVKDGRAHFKVRATKFYLFKTILKIAWQNIRKPALALLIFLYAFYFLMKGGSTTV